jgi:hypothetical protein
LKGKKAYWHNLRRMIFDLAGSQLKKPLDIANRRDFPGFTSAPGFGHLPAPVAAAALRTTQIFPPADP